MSSRKFRRVISEKLADRGIASLRFDYPGTGDALDDVDLGKGLRIWSDSLIAASEQLKARSGCERIVIVAQGLGAVIATEASAAINSLDAIAFLAPVVSGRAHLRELALWSKVVDENLGLADGQRVKGSVSIGSLTMPDAIAEEVRRINLMTTARLPASRALVAGRSDRPADAEFSNRLATIGAHVTDPDFQGYEQLIASPTVSRVPVQVVEGLVNWIAAQPAGRRNVPPVGPPAQELLVGKDFTEEPVRFGVNAHLSGVLCEPVGGRSGATVLFLTSAYDRHAGWGRSTVSMARALARCGIASLRFDTANVGDSPPVPGRPEQVLYHSSQNGDVSEAIDFLESRLLMPFVSAGRCSGAYLGLQSALTDPRIAGNISVNPAVLRWPAGRSVDDAVVNGTRNLQDYGRRAVRKETLARILRGDVDLAAAARNILRGIGMRMLCNMLAPFRRLLPEGRAIYGAFDQLRRRRTPISLIYSENDVGLEQCRFYFGHDGAGFARFPDVSVTIIANADHNLTPDHARALYLEAVRAMASRFSPVIGAGVSEPNHSIAAE